MLRLEDLCIDNLKIYQDSDLYCFTSDAVLLSRFARVKKDDVVADFCSGSGIVGINLYALNKDKVKSLTLFEMQKCLFDLSVKTIEYNNLSDKISGENVMLQDMPEKYKNYFSLIVCNPPYVKEGAGFNRTADSISMCKSEFTLNLKQLMNAVNYSLKQNGRFNIVHRADRILEVMLEMKKVGIEPKTLQFIGATNKAPYLFLLEGVKDAKEGLKLLPTIPN